MNRYRDRTKRRITVTLTTAQAHALFSMGMNERLRAQEAITPEEKRGLECLHEAMYDEPMRWEDKYLKYWS